MEPCAGDGQVNGGYHHALLLGALHELLEDPIDCQKARDRFFAYAPPDDYGFFEEVTERLREGLPPDLHALEAVLSYGGIFSGLTIRPGRLVENDTGFAGEEPWE